MSKDVKFVIQFDAKPIIDAADKVHSAIEELREIMRNAKVVVEPVAEDKPSE